MRPLVSLILCVVLCFGAPMPSIAWECSRVSTTEVQQALEEVGLPRSILRRAHADVTRFDHFLECPPQAMKFASRYVYSTRNVDAPYAEFLSFTFYSFRSNAVRDAMLAKVMSDDSEAIANPDFDIFYFVPAGRTDAVRVVRRRAVPID